MQIKGKREKNNTRRKKRTYTEKELNVPLLNTVAKPATIEKRRKKGKILPEDGEYGKQKMLGILADVNASQEGIIKSKIQRIQELEEVRRLKREEIERKEKTKESKLESKKAEIKGDMKKGKYYGTYRNKKES